MLTERKTKLLHSHQPSTGVRRTHLYPSDSAMLSRIEPSLLTWPQTATPPRPGKFQIDATSRYYYPAIPYVLCVCVCAAPSWRPKGTS